MTPDISAIARKFSREAWKFPLLKSRVVTAMTSAIEEATAPWKKAIEGLTPSGSEFVNDPKRCGEYIRQRISDTHDRCVEAVKAKHTAEEATASLRAQLEFADNLYKTEVALHTEALARMHAAEKALAQQRWIPVSERLPEDDGSTYLCYRQNGRLAWKETLTFIQNHEGGTGFFKFDSEDGWTLRADVTHWMPLPAAPRVAQESPLNGEKLETGKQ